MTYAANVAAEHSAKRTPVPEIASRAPPVATSAEPPTDIASAPNMSRDGRRRLRTASITVTSAGYT